MNQRSHQRRPAKNQTDSTSQTKGSGSVLLFTFPEWEEKPGCRRMACRSQSTKRDWRPATVKCQNITQPDEEGPNRWPYASWRTSFGHPLLAPNTTPHELRPTPYSHSPIGYTNHSLKPKWAAATRGRRQTDLAARGARCSWAQRATGRTL